MYAESVPVLVHQIEALRKILSKAEAHCAAKKIDPAAILTARLFPDMFDFTKQVQLVCDFAVRCGARLAGEPLPSHPDTEKTFAELQARLAKAVTYLNGLPKASFAGAAARELVIPMGKEERKMTGSEYFNTFLLPNFYFHKTTAYNILRHNGLEIGKRDFMGQA